MAQHQGPAVVQEGCKQKSPATLIKLHCICNFGCVLIESDLRIMPKVSNNFRSSLLLPHEAYTHRQCMCVCVCVCLGKKQTNLTHNAVEAVLS